MKWGDAGSGAQTLDDARAAGGHKQGCCWHVTVAAADSLGEACDAGCKGFDAAPMEK